MLAKLLSPVIAAFTLVLITCAQAHVMAK
jgi:hypothetical protein